MSAAGKQVLIVGGGLAGLACALRLCQGGARPLLFERSDGVGGRVRTDSLEGFLLDRGFQVFLSAYPEAGGLLDKASLDLRPFRPGALIHQAGGMVRLMDVFRAPRHLWTSARAPVGSLLDKLRVAKLRWQLTRLSSAAIAGHDDTTTERYLHRAGFSPGMIDGFFRAFYGGVFLERELRTSSRMFEFTFRMFSEGYATLPAQGMAAIPGHLAARLPAGTIRLGTEVLGVEAAAITLESGERIPGEAVVVATDATSAAGMMRLKTGPGTRWRAVTCLYFAAPHSPIGEPILALNGSGAGLVNNVCVPSDVAPRYAPPGQALISVSVLGQETSPELESRVLLELETWFGEMVREWRHLRTYRIQRALPEQALGSGFSGPGFQRVAGVYVCGDHLWSPSIEGAIVSGLRTAEAILRPS